MRYDEATRYWYFDTVKEFLDTEGLEGKSTCVEKGSFWGMLEKGIVVRGELRPATAHDRRRGYFCSALIVTHLHNDERRHNSESFEPPPPRTGKFDEFMDEIEATAALSRLQYVCVSKVFNSFLPSKLERRGYQRMDSKFGHPSFLKALVTGC